MIDPYRIEKGDKVEVFLNAMSIIGRVDYVPVATGDSWIILTASGAVHYVQVFLEMVLLQKSADFEADKIKDYWNNHMKTNKTAVLILLLFSLCANGRSQDFELLSVKARAESNDPDLVEYPVAGIVIGCAVVAVGYGVYKVIVNWCDKYLGTNTVPKTKTNAFIIHKSDDAIHWSPVGTNVCALQDFTWSETNSNPNGFYKVTGTAWP